MKYESYVIIFAFYLPSLVQSLPFQRFLCCLNASAAILRSICHLSAFFVISVLSLLSKRFLCHPCEGRDPLIKASSVRFFLQRTSSLHAFYRSFTPINFA
jgi:hypothetical protein